MPQDALTKLIQKSRPADPLADHRATVDESRQNSTFTPSRLNPAGLPGEVVADIDRYFNENTVRPPSSSTWSEADRDKTKHRLEHGDYDSLKEQKS